MITTAPNRKSLASARQPRRPAGWVFLALLSSALLSLLLAGSASAATPWWNLTSGARPSYLHAGAGANEVQKLSVLGNGVYYLEDPGAIERGVVIPAPEPEASYVQLPASANAGEIQQGLEYVFGAGNVEVTELASKEFRIAFTGNKSSQQVRLTAEGPVQITELAKGAPDGQIYVTAQNIGDATVDGATDPVTIQDILPPGLEATQITADKPIENYFNILNLSEKLPCTLATLSCKLSGPLYPFDQIDMRISVTVKPGAQTGELNEVQVTGGGASADSITRPITVSDEPVPFGVENYELRNEEEGGEPARRAGSHPFQQTTVIALNQLRDENSLDFTRANVNPAGSAKDTVFHWPAGLLGNPTPFPQCTALQFTSSPFIDHHITNCPNNTAVGVMALTISGAITSTATLTVPLFNMVPRRGEPARFAAYVPPAETPVYVDTEVRSKGDYGITVASMNITQISDLLAAKVTVWGTPGDPRHDDSRGWSCLERTRNDQGEGEGLLACEASEDLHPPAFLSLPTSCTGPLQTTVYGDGWANPFRLDSLPLLASYSMPGQISCNKVPFSPTMSAEPTSDAATSPTGLSFDLNIHDEGLENSDGLAQSQIKKAVVTLPQGFTTNPSVAEGLHACTEAEFERETVNSNPGEGCPNESKVGDVEVESPLIGNRKAVGSLYIAKQTENPNRNLLTIYLVVRNPELGVIVKQALKVTPDPQTGQLTTEVDNIPQLPFSRFHLFFRQGQRSPLVTPPACGSYAVKAQLYPWSRPSEPVERTSSFQITQGPEGGPCPNGVPPFHPGLEAGTINNAAGTYSPFYTHISRKDSEQEITHFSIKLPPGVIGKLAGVSSCSDAQIAAAKAREREGGGQEELSSPSCPANSEVGHSLVGSGVGNVLAYAPGKMYLAGPYHGSNLSLVSITAAKVGPFDLGTVVVRFALRINPETAEVFVDATGSDPIPHIVDGIPVHLRDIRAYVDRPQFVLNPTGCDPTSTASTVLGSGLNFASEADDQPVTVSSPFQAADCANLGFKPKLKLSLIGGTKRAAFPAFKAVLTARPGDANIGSAQVTLPHSEFLANAHIGTVCTRVQFKEGNVPGEKCPAASVYGKAKAITPLLDEPVEGPVYLRSSSHQLPDLVAALHNKQVDIALDGHVEGVKGGIRNTFEAVPDAPVTKFTLEMQGGKKGLLENSTNLCARPHHATAHFEGHNGKVENFKPLLQVKCKKHGKKKSHHGKHH